MDYRHHWHDVLVGSVLGLVLAYFSYRQYYPHLGTQRSHHPFPPRINRVDDDNDIPVLPMHHGETSNLAEADEEAGRA